MPMKNRTKIFWELENWPMFNWHSESLKPKLDEIRLLQGRLLGKLDDLPSSFQHQAQVDILVENVMRNREKRDQFITLDSFLVAMTPELLQNNHSIDDEPLSTILNNWVDIMNNHDRPLSRDQLNSWHDSFTGKNASTHINQFGIFNYKNVPNKTFDNQKIFRYEPPPKFVLNMELMAFIHWFNYNSEVIDDLLRAGIAHLWFVALKPYDGGNESMVRLVTDLALAQGESNSIKYYSFSSIMNKNIDFYNASLHGALNSSLDITGWLSNFLELLEDAVKDGISRINYFMRKNRYWQKHSQTILNARQLKLLNTLLDARDGAEEDLSNIYASKYMDLTCVSKATATRELTDLVNKNCIRKLSGGGRSTRYVISQ